MSARPVGAGTPRRTISSATRTRVVDAPVHEVWRVIEDPHQMPRWWPGIERMEGVEDDRFTQVFKTKRRRTVRADFRLLASDPPDGQATSGHRTWQQDVAGTPFEQVLIEAVTEMVVEPAQDGGTRVSVAQRQRLRGSKKMGAWAMRSATAKRLEQALDGLARLFG